MSVRNLGTRIGRSVCGRLIGRRCRDGDREWLGCIKGKVKPFPGRTYVGKEFGKVKGEFEVDDVASFEFAIETVQAPFEFVVVVDLFTVVSE